MRQMRFEVEVGGDASNAEDGHEKTEEQIWSLVRVADKEINEVEVLQIVT